MDRNQAKELLPIIQAYAEGKVIESRCIKGDKSLWYDDEDPSFDDDFEYRIKPEPKYRPFKDAEECWAEMLKHHPFGWVKDKETPKFLVCKALGNLLFFIGIEDKPYNYKEVLRDYTFADGTPFGVKDE
jgi:hypothetical protein